MAAQDARATTVDLQGPDRRRGAGVHAARACTISVRAYDKSHKLNRERKTRTFQQMSASDMVKKVAGEAGLTADSRVARASSTSSSSRATRPTGTSAGGWR